MTAITDQNTNSAPDASAPHGEPAGNRRSRQLLSGTQDAPDTSFDASEFAPTEDPTPAGQRSDRPWRIVGLIAMFGAVVLLGGDMFNGIDPSPGRSRSADSAMQAIRLEISNFGVEAGMTAGPVAGGDRTLITASGAFEAVMVPAGRASIVGLYRPGGTLIGLTTVDPSRAEAAIDGTRITPRTTAQTLVSLFPGVCLLYTSPSPRDS